MSNSPAFTRQIPGWGHMPGDHVSWAHKDSRGRLCGAVENLHPNDGQPVARIALHDTRHNPTGTHTGHYLSALRREAKVGHLVREINARADLDRWIIVVRETGALKPPPRYTTPPPKPAPPPAVQQPTVNLTEMAQAALERLIDSGRR